MCILMFNEVSFFIMQILSFLSTHIHMSCNFLKSYFVVEKWGLTSFLKKGLAKFIVSGFLSVHIILVVMELQNIFLICQLSPFQQDENKETFFWYIFACWHQCWDQKSYICDLLYNIWIQKFLTCQFYSPAKNWNKCNSFLIFPFIATFAYTFI